jgi:hypothetical protein
MLIKTALNNAIAFWRNDRLNFMASQMLDDRVRIVGFIRAQRTGLEITQQGECLWAVTGFAAREMKPGQRPQAFDQRVDLGAQSAPRSPERLVAVFLGAPAAC